jgi:uncharacterized protein YjbI with pentapeptide repeats
MTAMTDKELLKAYAEGERSFRKVRVTNADLRGADFSHADFMLAELKGNLSGANFTNANLSGAELVGVDLSRANFTDAKLIETHFEGSKLVDADLTDTGLWECRLVNVSLAGARFDGASLAQTVMLDIDLGPLCEAKVRHESPSTVDWRSVAKSIRAPNLKAFLIGTGMPEVFVEYMVECARSLDKEALFAMMQSTFISYGGPDEEFARKLHEALQKNGVRTFLSSEHAVPGEKLHRMMRKGVNEHDRVILICSRNSLDRRGVLNEIEETLQREARDGGASYLIPIRLDNYVFDGWHPPSADLAQAIRDRVVADFTDGARFKVELSRLLGALKKR